MLTQIAVPNAIRVGYAQNRQNEQFGGNAAALQLELQTMDGTA